MKVRGKRLENEGHGFIIQILGTPRYMDGGSRKRENAYTKRKK